MLDTLNTAIALGLVCLVLCAKGLARGPARGHVLLAALFVTFLTASTPLPRVVGWLPRFPGTYNWTGKLLELAVGLVAAALLVGHGNWSRRELGLTSSFKPGTGRDILRYLVPVLLVEIVVLGALVPGERPGLEDHLFQLTTPGVTEELAYRGVLLGLVDRAFPGRVRVCGAELGWGAVVSSIVFALWHGLDVSAGWEISVDLAPMAIPGVGGFVLAWCRARSGSLLVPVLVHAGMNEMANLIALAKALGNG